MLWKIRSYRDSVANFPASMDWRQTKIIRPFSLVIDLIGVDGDQIWIFLCRRLRSWDSKRHLKMIAVALLTDCDDRRHFVGERCVCDRIICPCARQYRYTLRR